MTTARILVIDDDPAVQVALPETLRLWIPGVLIDICGSGRVALGRIEATDYDAIVSDIRMPDMDGLMLLERIRTLRPSTPTILITGHGDHTLAIQALRGGAYDYIIKPVDREYVVGCLNRAIQMRHVSRQAEEHKAALERYSTQLQEIVETRTRELLNTLEQRVQERTADLMKSNEALQRELADRRHTEKALQEGQRSLYDMLETVPCLIVLTDPAGSVILFNRLAEELTGYTRDKVLGKRLADLFIPPAWEPAALPPADDAMAKDSSAHTMPWLTKTGQERLIEWRCSQFRSPQYEDPCVLGVGIDVTQRRFTENKIRTLNAELDQQVKAYATVVQDLKASKTALQEKIQDLEKFEEVVVGRELKMIALEKEIAVLRRERDLLKATREQV
ncbi:MAG TPA: response regulator [Nitrospiraceae bacterium]|nr:response regulator [Nitrospiraceae bacterium]